MKIDLSIKLSQIDGKPLENPKSKEQLTMKDVCVGALLDCPGDSRLEGDQKKYRYDLAIKMQQADGLFEIDVKDLDLVKDLIGKYWLTLVCGQTWNIIESLGPMDHKE